MTREGCLIVALSGRALAQSAQRGGLPPPAVIDVFGDGDTRAAAAQVVVVPQDRAGGFRAGPLRAAVGAIRKGAAVVPGSGFEACPALLAAIAAGRELMGNAPSLLERLQRPDSFFGLLDRLGIPHPEVRPGGRAPDGGWLAKRAGACGGGHIFSLDAGAAVPPGYYLQRRIEGSSLSAVFLADGTDARIVGHTRHWQAQPPGARRFRHSGMVALGPGGEPWRQQLAAMIGALVRDTGLRGLCGLDFMLGGEGVQVLELNPRPPASFELHEPDEGRDRGRSLFAAHLAACRGSLAWPDTAPSPERRAAAVLYAERRFRVPAGFHWPEWTRDRPLPGTAVAAGQPVCSVIGDGATAEAACAQAGGRMDILSSIFGSVAAPA